MFPIFNFGQNPRAIFQPMCVHQPGENKDNYITYFSFLKQNFMSKFSCCERTKQLFEKKDIFDSSKLIKETNTLDENPSSSRLEHLTFKCKL